MKVILYSLALLLLTIPSIFAQKNKADKPDPDHKNFYKEMEVETDDYHIDLLDMVGMMEYTKMKVRITNKTDDYLIFDGSKCKFKFDFGEFSPREKPVIIGPLKTEARVLNIKDDSRFHVDNYQIIFDGFTRIPAKGKAHEAPDFQLPASVNDFMAGPFEVTLLKLKKETDITAAQFRVTYKGSKIGFINPGKIGCKIESGQEFANSKPEYKTKLMEKGDSDKFTAYFKIPAKIVDMQFALMWIVWREAFQESDKLAVEGITADVQLDIGLTDGKNK